MGDLGKISPSLKHPKKAMLHAHHKVLANNLDSIECLILRFIVFKIWNVIALREEPGFLVRFLAFLRPFRRNRVWSLLLLNF